MNPNFRHAVFSLFIFLFLGGIAWAYLDDMLANDNRALLAYYPPPNHSYPIQYLPLLANVPAPTATAQPPATLHVGLNLRWDGQGHLNLEGRYWNPGTHGTRIIDRQVDGDTVRISGSRWYSPNPFGWPSESWYCHYNTNTNRVEMCSTASDPAWRWGYPWVLPAGVQLENGKTITVDGQVFNVSGPHTFLTGYGEEARFWRLVNRDKFLYHYSSGEYKQFVEIGDAVLFYGYDSRRFLLFSNIKRTYYKNDNRTSDTVRYEDWMTGLNGLVTVTTELRNTATQKASEPVAMESDEIKEAFLQERGIEPQSVGNPQNNR